MAIGDINHCNRKIGMVLVEVFQSIMAMRAGIGVKQIDFIIGNFFRCYSKEKTAASINNIFFIEFSLFNAAVNGFTDESFHFGEGAFLAGRFCRSCFDSFTDFGGQLFNVFNIVFYPFDITNVKHIHV